MDGIMNMATCVTTREVTAPATMRAIKTEIVTAAMAETILARWVEASPGRAMR